MASASSAQCHTVPYSNPSGLSRQGVGRTTEVLPRFDVTPKQKQLPNVTPKESEDDARPSQSQALEAAEAQAAALFRHFFSTPGLDSDGVQFSPFDVPATISNWGKMMQLCGTAVATF